MATQSARQPAGQQMELTMLVSAGCGRMAGEAIVTAPWNTWSLAAEEDDITEMRIPHVGNYANVTGVCQKCFHPCEHHICTACGASEYFPEAECGTEGCVRALYSFRPECYCSFQPRCREYGYWECARCAPGRTQFKSALACGDIVPGEFESAKSTSVKVSDPVKHSWNS